MKKVLLYILPVLAGVALLPIPLLRDLHFESAMLAGTIGCFWAGFIAVSSSSDRDIFSSLNILSRLYLASIPLFIYAWFSGCLTFDGIAFWILIPIPSVFLGTSIGRFIRKMNLPFPRLLLTFTLLFCAAAVLLIEFFTLPQVYFYNHVWGVWPGPIYDEAVVVSGSFLIFRFGTLLWISLLWVTPDWINSLRSKVTSGVILIFLAFFYLNLPETGITSPAHSIQKKLGGHFQTEHFEIYFDKDFYTQDEIRYWATRHEFHFQQIIDQLDIDWPKDRNIHSYLYAHAWQKKEITGAKFTSYVPIWLEQDHLHIAKQQLEGVLKHEMVHVISKQFGNQLFNGSWSIGLIEGLAESIAKDASPRSTLHQIVAADESLPNNEDMRSALSLSGFYGSAGSISYTTTGSFVEYLLDQHPVEDLKQAYRTANIEEAYSSSFEDLIKGWHKTLLSTELDSVDQQVSEFIFAQRSLFQKECPHVISKELRLWDEYNYLMASEDTLNAYLLLDDLHALNSENALIKAEWIRSKLSLGEPGSVMQNQHDKDSLLNINVLYADALYLSKGFEAASEYLNRFREDISTSTARNFRFTLVLREDSTQWNYLLDQRYSSELISTDKFQKMNMPNQLLTLNRALDDKNFTLAVAYLRLLPREAIISEWFDILEKAIHQTAYLGEYALANDLIETLKSFDLRTRYIERLSEQSEWLSFLQNRNYIDP